MYVASNIPGTSDIAVAAAGAISICHPNKPQHDQGQAV